MSQKVKLTWDGEKIKQQVEIEDMKLTPKQIIDTLDDVRGKIDGMVEQKNQMLEQMKQLDENIKGAKEFEAERKEFEERCLEIQEKKLQDIIDKIHDECKEKALKDAEEIIAKDPNAYTEQQKNSMAYLNYQKMIATNEKVAEKISRRVITDKLYDTPIFSNPFE